MVTHPPSDPAPEQPPSDRPPPEADRPPPAVDLALDAAIEVGNNDYHLQGAAKRGKFKKSSLPNTPVFGVPSGARGVPGAEDLEPERRRRRDRPGAAQ